MQISPIEFGAACALLSGMSALITGYVVTERGIDCERKVLDAKFCLRRMADAARNLQRASRGNGSVILAGKVIDEEITRAEFLLNDRFGGSTSGE